MKNQLRIAFIIILLAIANGYSQTSTLSTTKVKSNQIELGLRFGQNLGIDAVIPFSKAGRLHPNFTFGDNGVMLGTYVDWIWQINETNGLKIYPGVGPEFWFYDGFDIGVAGDFGMEYAFNFPMTIGFDWRPGFTLIDYKFRTGNWGFMARYRF